VKKLLLTIVAIALVVGLALSGCAPAAPTGQEIRVGMCATKTGMFAGFGQGGSYGVQYAVEDINKQGGIDVGGTKMPIKLIVVDNESDPNKTATLTESLILSDKAQFIVNGIDPPHIRSQAAIKCEQYGIPHITGNGPYESWMTLKGEAPKPWTHTWSISFAIATPAPEGDYRHGKPGFTMADAYLKALSSLATTNMKVAAFATDEPDGRGWYMSITPLMKEKGFDVYKVDKEFGLVPLETTDFSTLIKEWKDAGCESFWSNSPGPVFAALWKQAMAMGYKPKDAFATRAAVFYDDVISWGGNLAHGVSNEMFWNPGIKSCKGIGGTTPQSLADRYVKDTNLGYSQNLGFGYAAVQVLADAIKRAGSVDPEKVNAALKTTDLVTIYSRVAFDKDNYSRVPVAFGQWVSVDKPYKYENPVVLSVNDDLAATAEWEFPIKYKQ